MIKLKYPSFTYTLPVSLKKVEYRPFIVREEKILLTVNESGDKKTYFSKIVDVVKSCTVSSQIRVEDMCWCDFSALFTEIRKTTVGNIIEMNYKDTTDEQTYKVKINLSELKIEHQKNSSSKKTLTLDANTKITLKFPTVSDLLKEYDEDKESDYIIKHIDSIFHNEKIYKLNENMTVQELNDIIDNISSVHFKEIQQFISNVPFSYLELSYVRKDGTEVKWKVLDFFDFFPYG